MRTASLGHRQLSLQGIILALSCAYLAAPLAAAPPADEAVASREHLATEISAVDGQVLRAELLRSVCEDADCRLAHWYSGEILRGGKWLSIDATIQQAADDERLSEYRRIRDSSADSAPGHEKLARWCRKQELADLARVHWFHVLRFQPKHRAALRELGLSWNGDRLLAQDEIKGYQAEEREFRKRKKKWRAKAKRIRRAMEQGGADERLAARQQLRQIREPAAVPTLLEEFSEEAATEQKTLDRRTELMEALGTIDDPLAVESLVKFAIGSPRAPVRYAAIDQLKSKPYHQFVPTLLAAMSMPIEASVSLREVGNQIVSSYWYEQEGPGEKQYERNYRSARTVPGQRYIAAPIFRSRTTLVRDAYTVPQRTEGGFMCNGHWVPERTIAARHFAPQYRTVAEHVDTKYGDNPVYQAKIQREIERSRGEAAGEGRRIAELNQAIKRQNESIAGVLTEVTGESLDAFPKSWWNWWSDHLDRHPDLAGSGARQALNAALLNQDARGLSRGTWVWTLQGLRAVEKVRVGDYVLAQKPDSGELAYQAVLAVAPRRDLQVSKIDFADSSLHCAAGHVVWRSGGGWRRVAKLATSDTLHGVKSEPRLAQVADVFTIDCYDLVIDQFHTFFVGEAGILVHDATPIKPNYAALPGFSPADVAHAARLAANVER